METNQLIDSSKKHINKYLSTAVEDYSKKSSTHFKPLIDAISYTLLDDGKRIRPLLVMASGHYLNIPEKELLPLACAIEFIHTFSLIHDDLPGMDNDETRRGKASSHVAFGEGAAILAGDALLTHAFDQMARLSQSSYFSPIQIIKAIQALSQRTGISGMVGGQYLDIHIEAEKTQQAVPLHEFISIHKTGALMVASVEIPALLRNDSFHQNELRSYGELLGLAYQMADDHSDSIKAHSQPHLGRTEVVENIENLINEATQALSRKKEASYLIALTQMVKDRVNIK